MNMTVYFKGGGKIPLVSFAKNILHLAFCSQSMRLTIQTDVAMQSNIRKVIVIITIIIENMWIFLQKRYFYFNLQSQSDESGIISRI